MRCIVATRNRDKLAEIKAILDGLPIDLADLEDFPQLGNIEETGRSVEENALLKARTVHRATGLAAIADDTALEVAALRGAPGVYSARYAGPSATYDDNLAKLLTQLAGVPQNQRNARFRTCAAFVDGLLELTEIGIVEGSITQAPTGAGGFGYDPVFRPLDYTQTFGEMSPGNKHRISHRGKAFRALRKSLSNQFSYPFTKEIPA